MQKISLKVTAAEIFVFVMQLLYFAASSEVSQSDFYDLILIFGYSFAGLMAILACMTKRIDLQSILILLAICVLQISGTVNYYFVVFFPFQKGVRREKGILI